MGHFPKKKNLQAWKNACLRASVALCVWERKSVCFSVCVVYFLCVYACLSASVALCVCERECLLVCVCMFLFLCVYACLRALVALCVRVSESYEYIYACIHVCTYTHKYMCTHAYTHTHIYKYVYKYKTDTTTCEYMYAYLHTHTHTHLHRAYCRGGQNWDSTSRNPQDLGCISIPYHITLYHPTANCR